MTTPLIDALTRHANHRGLVLAHEDGLRSDTGMKRDALHLELSRLVEGGEIEILTPLPFLVARLRKWSDNKPIAAQTPAKTAGAEARAYSYSYSQSKLLKDSYRHQPADDALLREILETLGETNPTSFRGAIRSYSPEVIRTALERVRRMKTVRKSPTALFRFLLPRIARQSRKIN
jgi:hypothetical protein